MPTTNFKIHADLSDADFAALLQNSGKYKERSDKTHHSVHAPLILEKSSEPIWCLLLGDSMLERFKTTGIHTELGQRTFPEICNVGVGGDRIQNVLYRLGSKGLFQGLKSRVVKHVILQMGTNDLRPKRGLNSQALEQYGLVLEAVHRAAAEVRILVTGLMPRKDVEQSFTDQSNVDLQQLVQDLNGLMDKTSGEQAYSPAPFSVRIRTQSWEVFSDISCLAVYYMPPNPAINSTHLVDRAHLNEEGYTLFGQELWRKLERIEADV